MSDREPGEEDASRRTYLASERTLLAWWRTGLASFAVAIGIGRLVPSLLDVSAAPFVTLGAGYGLVGLAFVVLGAWRGRTIGRQLAVGRFESVQSGIIWTVTLALVVLGLGTLALLVLGS